MIKIDKSSDEKQKIEGGLRLKGYCKSSKNDSPLFTIITVTFNSGKSFEETISSVLNQTYDNVEYIIVDGGSTNGTLDIIREYDNRIDYWTSEPDKGIYDAMNKGIDCANGDWLIFINSDDVFANNNVIQTFSEVIKRNPGRDLIYGKVAVMEKDIVRNYMGKPITRKYYWYPSICICHQGVFFNKNAFKKAGKFEVGLRGGISDYAWLVRWFYFGKNSAMFVDEVVAKFSIGGYSEKNIWEAYLSHLQYAKKHFPFFMRFRFYIKYPEYFLKFKILNLHKDTSFRRFYRNIKYRIRSRR